ncbi:hypothetical protein [Streptomyces sp. NPDC057675]|uniref:hypothetical protein n=1 Tax=Streptomyces sp. NPDC057675 TaxID=3346204 RepID=UPI0036CA92E6
MLEWLSDTAYDADDERVALGERHYGVRFLHEYDEMRAFRDLRPTIFCAVHPLLCHESAEVRDAALVAAVPLAEHPFLPSTVASWSATPTACWTPALTATTETASWTR